jgi:hypothetical protein
MGQVAGLRKPLYGALKEVLFQSKVIGTDDTGVKVLDDKLPYARTGRIWPYHGDQEHPVVVFDYTKTRERIGRRSSWRGIAVTYRWMPTPDTTPSSKNRGAD